MSHAGKHVNVRRGEFTWEGVDLLKYKEEGSHFKTITRQVLFQGQPDLPTQLRYFEIAADGHSTLERHEHRHVVMILRGQGSALLGDEIITLQPHDVVEILPKQWHQFRANTGETFGFLCLVSVERDKPERPDPAQLLVLQSDPQVAAFIRV